MYWNDPTLYGATIPFRDIPERMFAGQPLAQWPNVPRFLPEIAPRFMPTYGHNVPFGTVPQQPFVPYLQHTLGYNPMTLFNPMVPQSFIPQNFIPQNLVPQSFVPQNFMPHNLMPQNVMPHTYNQLNPFTPFFNPVRPFTY
jgi:hypothetical protein